MKIFQSPSKRLRTKEPGQNLTFTAAFYLPKVFSDCPLFEKAGVGKQTWLVLIQGQGGTATIRYRFFSSLSSIILLKRLNFSFLNKHYFYFTYF